MAKTYYTIPFTSEENVSIDLQSFINDFAYRLHGSEDSPLTALSPATNMSGIGLLKQEFMQYATEEFDKLSGNVVYLDVAADLSLGSVSIAYLGEGEVLTDVNILSNSTDGVANITNRYTTGFDSVQHLEVVNTKGV